jgi:hypothetical protein
MGFVLPVGLGGSRRELAAWLRLLRFEPEQALDILEFPKGMRDPTVHLWRRPSTRKMIRRVGDFGAGWLGQLGTSSGGLDDLPLGSLQDVVKVAEMSKDDDVRDALRVLGVEVSA